ncbi:MAG: hypothetical protein JO112_13690, partial [Planctomycetes bacterium]|nr:hypothetical protein [Planctomycetota bacterium]
MRLTLRTLLAYLDDTLEPVQTKRIGQVVADNPQAQELITRIKDVVRRRRLTPPGATETNEGLDANTLAEYLDNALPPDQLAKVEETALGSDVTLAELAACHQILTLLQTEPPLVPPAARGRMYGLAKGPQAATAPRKKVAADVPSPAPAPTQEPASAAPAASSSSPWFRQAAILAGVFLLGILITVAVLYSLRGVWQKSPVHVAPAGPNTEVALNKGPSPEEKAAAAKEEQEKKEKQAAADKLTATLKAAAEKEAAEKAAQQKAAAEKAAAEKGAAEPKTAPEKENPPLPDNPPSTDRVEVGTYVVSRDSPSILLDRQENTAPWKRVADRSPVFSNDTLVSLPGYRSEVDLKSGVHLVLWGNLLPDGRPVSVLE